MGAFDWTLEVMLIGLLALTLLHAVRLQRALAGLRRERSALGDAVAGFDASTRDAEAGLGRLHQRAQDVADHVARKIEAASVVKEDLTYLTDRGEQLADRLEALVRAGRGLDGGGHRNLPSGADRPPQLHSQAERELAHALRGSR